MPETESQLANSVLMIRPVRFVSNPMTAASNRFQGRSSASAEELQRTAANEFDGLVSALGESGVNVVVVDDTPEPHTPDSIFPNNWVSFHADGRVVLYPMEAENRRTERRGDIIDYLVTECGFQVSDIVDLSGHEANGRFLEGTGSMVLDRRNRIAYACLSSRTQLDPLRDFAQRMDYEAITFDAVDQDGVPIYHTNVLMNIGDEIAVICADSIPRIEQRDAVTDRLRETGRDVLTLSFEQLEAFAGNMLELRNQAGERVLALSLQTWESLNKEQRNKLLANGKVVTASIANIEAAAGGSVRCMIAEIHLPETG